LVTILLSRRCFADVISAGSTRARRRGRVIGLACRASESSQRLFPFDPNL
jgi:hypothetical protein